MDLLLSIGISAICLTVPKNLQIYHLQYKMWFLLQFYFIKFQEFPKDKTPAICVPPARMTLEICVALLTIPATIGIIGSPKVAVISMDL